MSHPYSHLFVSIELAKNLNNVGFECNPYFKNIILKNKSSEYQTLSKKALIFYEGRIGIPLWQQVVDWFREEHNMEVGCERESPNKNSWMATIYFCNPPNPNRDAHFRIYPCHEGYDMTGGTYYQALECAIGKAIEVLKARKL